MEHIQWEIREELRRQHLWDTYFEGRRTCVLDIETTGLDRVRNHFILGGLYDPANQVMHQVFAERRSEEKEALAVFAGLLSDFDVAVTYNGRHFDLPFLEERSRRNGISAGACGTQPRLWAYDGYDLDLYQVLNGHSPLRRLLPNLKQKTVETYMGLWTDRADEISGAESVQLYAHFEATGDPEARRQILLHNSDDVLQLTRLAEVIGKSDFHRAMYHMGFPVGSPPRRWQVRKIRIVRDRICAEGTQGAERMEYRGFELGGFPLQIIFDAKAGTFRFDIPVVRSHGIAAADLRGAGLPEREFQKYPDFGSGFLVVEDRDGVKYREVNHLIRSMTDRFEEML